MARLIRYVIPGVPQHIIQRGNNREPLFAADEDYRYYKCCLQQAAEKHGLQIHAYVLMTNHVHLLASPDHEHSISKVMQSIGRKYVQFFNYSYRRTGTLWEGRYRATIVQATEYLFICSRYIELNPVRAGMAANPADYPWSSFPANALGSADDLITPHWIYQKLALTEAERQSAYREMFRGAISDESIAAIREATNGGWALGNNRFKEKIESLTARRASRLPHGGEREVSHE